MGRRCTSTAAPCGRRSQQWVQLLLVLLMLDALVISRRALGFRLGNCPFSTDTSGTFMVTYPGCKLTQIVMLGAGDIMNVSGNVDAEPMHELRAKDGSPTTENTNRHFIVNGTGAELRLTYLRLTNGRGTIGDYNSESYGGSIKLLDGALLHVSACAILGCGVNVCARGGGGVYVKGSRAIFDRTLFEGNSAEYYGSAMIIYAGSNVLVSDSTFKNNQDGDQSN